MLRSLFRPDESWQTLLTWAQRATHISNSHTYKHVHLLDHAYTHTQVNTNMHMQAHICTLAPPSLQHIGHSTSIKLTSMLLTSVSRPRVGSYSVSFGDIPCLPCAPGYAQPSSGSTSCNACQPGCSLHCFALFHTVTCYHTSLHTIAYSPIPLHTIVYRL